MGQSAALACALSRAVVCTPGRALACAREVAQHRTHQPSSRNGYTLGRTHGSAHSEEHVDAQCCCATLCRAIASAMQGLTRFCMARITHNGTLRRTVMGTVRGISSAVHYVMYVTIDTVSIPHTVRARVNSANRVIAFRLLHCAKLCAEPFRLKARRNIHRFSCGSRRGGCVRHTLHVGTVLARHCAWHCWRQCRARALHSAVHDACIPLARRCSRQAPRKDPLSHYPARGVHSALHSVKTSGPNEGRNGHMPAPCRAQCSAQCPAPWVHHLLS